MSEKSKTMTEKERVEALLKGNKPDRIPIWPWMLNGFAVIYNQLSITDAYTNPEACYESQLKACRDFGWVFVPLMGYASMGAWEFGGEIRMPSGDYDQAPMVTRYPVEKEEDLQNLKWPGPDSGFFPTLAKFGAIARREMLDNEPFNAILGALDGYNLACSIIGSEKFFKWMLKKPQLIHDTIDSICEWGMDQMSKQSAMLGTEGVMGITGSATTSNQLISPKHFEEFALPCFIEGQKKIRALGYKTTYVHICGEQNANLPYWSQVDFGDPGIISVGHEIKLETAARYFPDNIILGNLEPAILLTATPEEVYEATKTVVQEGKKIERGYIFSPGCDLPPKTPVENIRMMNKAVEDFGWY